MFRNQIRRGIRAVNAGDHPTGLCRDADTVIPTYCNDTVVRVPAVETRFDLETLDRPLERIALFSQVLHERLGTWIYRRRGWMA